MVVAAAKRWLGVPRRLTLSMRSTKQHMVFSMNVRTDINRSKHSRVPMVVKVSLKSF